MTITELCERAHAASREKGWYDDGDRNVGELLMLVTSELAEAMECYREGDMEPRLREDGKPEGFASELADVVIRLGDMAAYLGIDLERAVIEKMTFNTTRPYRHGGKRA